MDAEAKPTYFGKDLEAMSFAVNHHNWIRDELRPYFGSEMAEVGAGVGSFSKLIAESGVKRLTAFEPSRNMFPLLAQNMAAYPNVEAINGFFGKASRPAAFDSVAYINVLEHIEKDAEELAHAYAALKPGGHLLLFVPALGFLFSRLDQQLGHYRRYQKPGLSALARAAGFSIQKVKYFDCAGVIPWYLAYVLLKRPMAAGSVGLYDSLIIPATRALERIIPPPFGKNLLLVAKKP